MEKTLHHEALLQVAEAFAAALQAQTGEPFDFSFASLGRLDSILDEWLHAAVVYGGAAPVDLQPYALPILAYIGETLRRGFGGHWEHGQAANRPLLVLSDGTTLDLAPLIEGVLGGTMSPSFATLPSALTQNDSRPS